MLCLSGIGEYRKGSRIMEYRKWSSSSLCPDFRSHPFLLVSNMARWILVILGTMIRYHGPLMHETNRKWFYAKLCPSPTLGRGGHLDLLHGFTSPKCVSASVCISARLCLHNIPYSLLPMAFKFSDMVNMDKTLN